MIKLLVGSTKSSEFDAPESYATVETPEGVIYVLVPRNGPSADRLAEILKNHLERSLSITGTGNLAFEASNSVVQAHNAALDVLLIERLKNYARRGLSPEGIVHITYHTAVEQCTNGKGNEFLNDLLKASTEGSEEASAEEASAEGSEEGTAT